MARYLDFSSVWTYLLSPPLHALFHASITQVQQAASHPVAEWRAELAAARPRTVTPSLPRSRKNITSPIPPTPTKRPGDRANARLIEPEPFIDLPEVAEFDEPGLEIDDAAMEQAITDAIEALDQEARGVPASRKSKNAWSER